MAAESSLAVRLAVLWHDTILSEEILPTGTQITIGDHPDAQVLLDGIDGLQCILDANGWLYLTPEMQGRVSLRGQNQPVTEVFADVGERVALGVGDWALLELGAVGLLVEYGYEQPTRLPRTAPFRLERGLLGSLLFGVVGHLSLLIVAFLFWEMEPALASTEQIDRFVTISMPAQQPEPPPIVEAIADPPSATPSSESFGQKALTPRPPKSPKTTSKKPVGVHRALNSKLMGSGPLKSLFAKGPAFQNKLGAAGGGGDGMQAGHGAGGLGLRGVGGGGPGGGFGRHQSFGGPPGIGGGRPHGRLASKKARKPTHTVKVHKGTSTSFCKEKDIRRVVSARSRGITHCYERALSRNPELSGKVTLRWAIGLSGEVTRTLIDKSTLQNKDVEACMRRQVKRWRFPKPEGGTCQVRYPFVFDNGL